jgi:hypothetical protein
MATTRYPERVASSLGQAGPAPVKFEAAEGICGAGVLTMVPALLAQGLMVTRDLYKFPQNQYYGLESIVLTLAFMALARIKNPEQLKQCKPGEIGRIMGLDRVPEVRCLREKIKCLSGQQKAQELNNKLVDLWYDPTDQDASFLYIDGHQRIYYGSQANLPAKYISRQKLCLSATTEYWVNDATGMPVMMVMGELTEKLETAIETLVIPQMLQTSLLKPIDAENPPEQPQCTFVFDREAYHPAFFNRLWKQYRIAILTYRKNVKDSWPEENFQPLDVEVLGQSIPMHLCGGKITLDGYTFTEVRKLGESGHQTAIITTHPSLKMADVAGRMFARWVQENFFRYLIADYDFDKMVEFGTQPIDPEKQLINPLYRKADYKLKSHRKKIGRIKAKLYPLAEMAIDKSLDELPEITAKQAQFKEALDQLLEEEKTLLEDRAKHQKRIKLKDMPEDKRYDQLKTESKLLMNVIKMICYRAESAVLSLIRPHLNRAQDEGRMLIKQLIQNNADIFPDEQNETLTVVLYSLSAQRFNHAAEKLIEELNKTETIFPGTNLTMIFKITANPVCEK